MDWPPTIGVVVEASSVFTAVTAAELGVTTFVVAVLLLGFGSGVVLPAVVTSWTVPALVGVNVVAQVIVPLTGSGFGTGAGVQVVVAPAGVPPGKLTMQVALAAGSGPAFLQVVITVTGVPIVPGTLVGPVACRSAWVTGTVAQVALVAGQVVGGVPHTVSLVVQPCGGVVVLCVATLKILVVFAGNTATVWNVALSTCGVPDTIGLVTVIVQSVPAAAGSTQSVVPFVSAVNVVFCGTTS
jgi:hypothetical protein